MSRKSQALIGATDRFVEALLARASARNIDMSAGSASPSTDKTAAVEGSSLEQGLPSISDQVDVLEAVTRYLAVKHKIQPDEEKGGKGDFLSRARRQLGGAGVGNGHAAQGRGGAGKGASQARPSASGSGLGVNLPADAAGADDDDA